MHWPGDVDGGTLAPWRITRTLAQHGRTALICAAATGYADCVRLLLNAGADTNATDGVRANRFACGIYI